MLTVDNFNDAPILTGEIVQLGDGHEDICYTFKEADLLKGYSDVDGDALSIENLKATIAGQDGELTDLGDGSWALHTPLNTNGQVTLSYAVSDGHGGLVDATSRFELKPINDAPVAKRIELKIDSDHPEFAELNLDQLLSGASDVDGDALRVVNLRSSTGEAIVDGFEGGPAGGRWGLETGGASGTYTLLFDVTDGELTTQAEAVVTVEHQPLHTSFEFATHRLEAAEGQSNRIEIRRFGETRIEQTVHLKLAGSELSADDLGLGEAVFQKGSDRAFVELAFNRDGLWEGIERGQLVVDRVDGPSNSVCEWRNHSVELCINDEDSRHDGRGNHQSENDYGIAGAIQQRLADADYSDGQHSPAGADREGARVISNRVIDQVTTKRNRRQLSDFVWGWGQFIDHDIVATEGSQESMPIPIPADDFFLNDPDIEFCDEDPNELQPDGTYSDETARFTAANHFTFTRSAGFTDANGVRQHRNGITSFWMHRLSMALI